MAKRAPQRMPTIFEIGAVESGGGAPAAPVSAPAKVREPQTATEIQAADERIPTATRDIIAQARVKLAELAKAYAANHTMGAMSFDSCFAYVETDGDTRIVRFRMVKRVVAEIVFDADGFLWAEWEYGTDRIRHVRGDRAISRVDRDTVEAAKKRLKSFGAPDLADCAGFVDGDTVRIFREQDCIATLTYNGYGCVGSWEVKRSSEGKATWTTKQYLFGKEGRPDRLVTLAPRQNETDPVCPRCLGIEPGKPGGDPELPDPGPYTEDLCEACKAATPPTSPAATAKPEHEDPADIARQIIGDLGEAMGEMKQLIRELNGEAKPAKTISIVLAEGGVTFLVADTGTASPVNATAVLDAFRARHPVSYEELYDVTLELGSPPKEKPVDIADRIKETLGKANARAERELQELRALHADVLGVPVEELDAHVEEQKRTEAAAKPKRVASSARRRGRRASAALEAPAAHPPAPATQAADMEPSEPRVDEEPAEAEATDQSAALSEDAPLRDRIAMRKITDRQRELLSVIYVEEDRAIFGSDERIPDWPALKEVMVALGGTWRKGSKKIKGGFVFPDGTDVSEVVRLAKATGEILDPRLVGFVPTPAALADLLVEWVDPEPGDVILEPEAGTGRIVEAIVRHYADGSDATVICYEILAKNREALGDLAYTSDGNITIAGEDFLAADPEKNAQVDGCAMNPPFENRADIRHVRHAARFVKPGKRLAAIVSAGAMFREDKETVEFRKFVEQHGTIEALPDGSFAEEGTGVRTAIVRITTCPSCPLRPEDHHRPLF